ncbi:3-hydroxyacyl-CoA dehydrogenase [Insolitispirillum peregrinum]|uniref:NAD(P)-dependent dehydrogenase, short-chain alcohol dehydrogenase family n=1 Tax=Insolitispirillum peregrinum TaxID=80876 RepID=A0A1N7K295_9PROT|nr:3-hydroxyacyl-CoA dehydrogenase [Insolitispirillum peregrinum]SIS55554.1 NAD(P)-dependent dehydrogenase, short-chain alcohol dehydrogenase family [Insolitispirillum peregrinum]
MNLLNSVFLITGAGSGLGAITATVFARAGAKVVLIDLNADALAAQVNQITAETPTAALLPVTADVTSEADAQRVIDTAVATFGTIHGLVNCAGIAPGEKVVGRKGPHRLDSFARAVSINLIGTFNMLRLAAAVMVNNSPNDGGERGVIINTASIAAFDGQIGQAAYAASKAGVAGMTLPIARELAGSGIRVLTIAPGIFATPMMEGMPDEVKDTLNAMVPFPPRMGKPAEYAALAQHMVENGYLNGEVIRLDGAIRMPAK